MRMTDCVHYKACSRLADMFMSQSKRDQALTECDMNCPQYVPGMCRRISIMTNDGEQKCYLREGYDLRWVNLEAQRLLEKYRWCVQMNPADRDAIIRKGRSLGIFRADMSFDELRNLAG